MEEVITINVTESDSSQINKFEVYLKDSHNNLVPKGRGNYKRNKRLLPNIEKVRLLNPKPVH